MADGKLNQKVRKKLGMPAAKPVRIQPQSTPIKLQSQPKTKGCCGKGR